MKRQIFFFLILFLVSCSPLNQDTDPGRRVDEPEGEPVDQPTEKDLEGLSWTELLRNCRPEIDIPDNEIDIFLGMIPGELGDKIREINIPGNARKCAQKKIEETHDKICKAREDLERRRKRARSDSEKASIQNSLHQLDITHWRFNERLRKMSEEMDKRLIRIERKDGKTFLGRIGNSWGKAETEAWRDMLDIQSYRECSYYSEDDD